MNIPNAGDTVHIFISVFGGILGWFIGERDAFLYTLIAFVLLDYITGILGAIIKKKLSSNVGAKGICKKILIFIVVSVGHIIDTQLIGKGSALRTAILFFYISNEGISILENTIAIGLPVPDKLKNILAQLKERDG